MNPEEIKRIAELRVKADLTAEEKTELNALALKETSSAVKTAVLESKEDMLKEVNAQVSELLKTVGAQDEKIKAFENSPVLQAKTFNIRRFETEHLGHKLINLNEEMRNKAAAQPHIFPVFANDQKADEFSMYMLDFMAGTQKKPNMEAKQRLEEKSKEILQKTTLVEGVDAQGGYLVPQEYQMEIIKLSRDMAFGLRECKVIEMARESLKLPAEATIATADWSDEQGEISQGEGTFGEVTLTARRLDSRAVLSNELIADSAIDVVGLLMEQISSAINLKIDNQILNGNSAPMSGFLYESGFATDVTTSGTTYSTMSAEDFSEMIGNVENQGDNYLSNAKFLLNWRTKHTLRSLQDATGRYIYAQPGGGVPGTIWEYPYFTSNQLASTDAADQLIGIYGNFKYVLIGRRKGVMILEADPYSFFKTYQTQFRVVTRWGMAFGLKKPFSLLKTASA